jgi:GT2 family glycosyltransferase/glycosyltransferase involved in cell wall biosynthesis
MSDSELLTLEDLIASDQAARAPVGATISGAPSRAAEHAAAAPSRAPNPWAPPAAVETRSAPAVPLAFPGGGEAKAPADMRSPPAPDAVVEFPSHAKPPGEAGAKAATAPAPAPPKRVDTRPKPKMRGNLDSFVNGVVEGWAIDESAPMRRLQVEIWRDNVLLDAAEASLPREDLAAAKLGDGKCAFRIRVPAGPSDGKEHTIFAKISGSEAIGSITNTAPSRPISGAIEQIDGLTARGWVETLFEDGFTIDVYVDGDRVGEHEMLPYSLGRFGIAQALPVNYADGRPHWLSFKVRETGATVAQTVAILPMIATPEAALQSYARDFPGHLSTNAAARYASVAGQFSAALDTVAKQADGPGKLTLAEYVKQLARAHAQVKMGIKEQNKTPDALVFPRFERPDVSIVIPAHNKFWVTYNCLAALLLAPNKHTFEVIVVDDGSSDITIKLPDYIKGVTVLRNEVSQGFVRSSNLGGRHARGDFVVMLNNDTEPCAGWIDELIYVFDNFNDVGMAGAKFVYPDGKLQEAGGILFPNLQAWNYGRNGNPFDPKYNYTRQVDYVSGACIMLRKSVWDKLGGFDELFAPAYYEDTDLAFRVRALGLKTYYTPFSQIIHFEGVSSGTSLTTGVKRYQAINEPKFRSRWASTLRNGPVSLNPEIARDRGVALRALVIDVEIPQPDKDAGSYAAVQEMRLLIALGFKLTFVPTNMAYLGDYTEQMERMGVECVYAPFATSVDQVIETRGAEFDLFYITRYSVADMFIERIRSIAPNAKIVFNNADLHFLREIRAAIAAKNAEALPKALQTRDQELSVMRRVDVTLSYTETEAAVILSHNLDSSKVARCPWVIEVETKVKPFAGRSGLAFLGNFRHPPNEEAVRYFISELMPALRRKTPGIVLRIYGANMPADLRKLAGDDVIVSGYVPDVAEVYQNCRIFVAPLQSGAGIKGKVIGALAAGIPTIMTSLAGEGVGISRGVEAVIADSASEWVAAVSMLYNDEKRWTDMSRHALQFARENFSFESGLKKMSAALAPASSVTTQARLPEAL